MNGKKTKTVKIGDIKIGGKNPIVIQSMTKTDTRNIKATVKQIHNLEKNGCEIVRVAIVDFDASSAIKKIKEKISIPIVADIHFNYRLALSAIENGADKIRINPGNIGHKDRVKEVIKLAKERRIPVRIGVNIGSLEKKYKNYKNKAKALVESALDHIKSFEDSHFYDIVVSLKSSNVVDTISAYRMLSSKIDYPLHLGITEAGTDFSGTIKSAVGIGVLLSEGIGDTIRVSLTASPVEEVRVAYEILRALNLKESKIEIVSCPGCGRTEVNQFNLAKNIEKKVFNINKKVKISVMGCVVNGPGEAREADIGVVGGRGVGIIFKHGKILKKVREKEIIPEVIKEVKKI